MCFYINLPIGPLAAAMLLVALHLPSSPRPQQTWMQLLWDLDPVGQMLFLPSIICVLIALQWPGTVYAWSSPRIIVLMAVFAILLVAFIINELWMGPKATIPPKVASQRTVAAASCFAFFNYAQFFIFVYFIPIYFQAIRGVDAEQSDINTIPLIMANNAASLTSGILTTKFEAYVQYIYGCSILIFIGAGLITTWQVDSSNGMWIGYQTIFGFDTDLALALSQVVVQLGLASRDISIDISMTIFLQFFEGVLFVFIGNNIFDSKLVQYVSDILIHHSRLIVELSFKLTCWIRLDSKLSCSHFQLNSSRIEHIFNSTRLDSTWNRVNSTRLVKNSSLTSRELNIEIFSLFALFLCITFLHLVESHDEEHEGCLVGSHGRKPW